MASQSHQRTPTRTTLTRRTTRGPLDSEDPLSVNESSQHLVDTPAPPEEVPSGAENKQRLLGEDISEIDPRNVDAERDLSFLLDRSLFHPLSQVDIPPALRTEFPGPPPPGTKPQQIFQQIDDLTSKGDFIAAAHLSVLCLTSGFIKATDAASIFKLLIIRFSCLEIMGQTMLAAQEAKSLEDLGSDFYFLVPEDDLTGSATKQHIMPFHLRVQAIRLQTIGFSDPRRGITMLYALGYELREKLASKQLTKTQRTELTEQLSSLSLHVINSLIEIGDIECAHRMLLHTNSYQQDSRIILLLLKLGRIQDARNMVDNLPVKAPQTLLNKALLELAEGNLNEAISLLKRGAVEESSAEHVAVKQNLAVALLYVGLVQDAQINLRQLVDEGHSFPSLMINLSTIFELTSDKAKEQKQSLIDQVAQLSDHMSLTNFDFKL